MNYTINNGISQCCALGFITSSTVLRSCAPAFIMCEPIVSVYQGQLRGSNEKNINGKDFVAFRGVPYATPPVGDLRFKDCEPLTSWSGVRDATKFGDRCAQQDWMTRKIVGSDDCLYLNIYSQILNPRELKAVMVWIHGGGFISGSGDDVIYGPDYLIEKDIVLVTINYRLGIFGFLNVEDEEAPGNQGLKDQVQALKWIQQNIGQFGGDPNNITIFGESAGGASVHYLTISPLTQGLFHKAIIQSGVAVNPWANSSQSSIEIIKKLADILNRDCSDIKEFVNYLRAVDAHRLIAAMMKIRAQDDKMFSIHSFIPSVDSKAKMPFLSIPLKDAIKGGIKVPCICGYVSHEGMIVLASLLGMKSNVPNTVDEKLENFFTRPKVLQVLKESSVTVSDIKRFYFRDRNLSSESIESLIDMFSTVYFTIGIHNIVEIQSKIPNIPMYLYKFEYELENSLLKKFWNVDMKGTCHGEELNFLFYPKFMKLLDTQPMMPSSIESLFIERFTELWTNFAKTGIPTPQTTKEIPIQWERVDSSHEYKYLYITDKLIMDTEMNIIHQLFNNMKNKL